ncbi:hypothetical protein [uncultured Varibaculum sp.]|uniref:hypothetical protein n=1 Tax=uncultured Varibaculum sp. TaxID=413896 RepID=UPI00338E309A
MVALNEHGGVVRPAILWNDTRSARAAEDLIVELDQDTWLEAHWHFTCCFNHCDEVALACRERVRKCSTH